MRRLGPVRLEVLNTGVFALDGGALFGVVPQPQWSKRFPPDDQGRVRLAARVLLLRHDDGSVILADVGLGDRWMGRARRAYAIEEGDSGGLVEQLAARGLEPADVTDVIVTHLHFDHVGGLVRRDERQKKLVPQFPRARVHVQAEHLRWACSPSLWDRASFRAADFMPLVEASLVVEHDGPVTLRDGLELRVSHGHTPAMHLPLISAPGSAEGAVFFPSDLIPTAAHLRLPWGMAFDTQPLVTVEEKEGVLVEARDQRWVLVLDHDPELSAFTLGPRFEVVPVEL